MVIQHNLAAMNADRQLNIIRLRNLQRSFLQVIVLIVLQMMRQVLLYLRRCADRSVVLRRELTTLWMVLVYARLQMVH